MKDEMFYGKGTAPMGRAEMIKIDGQWYSKHDLDYIKSQSKPKKIEETKLPRAEQLERLVLMQGEETRLVKQLERTRGVISHIKQWLIEDEKVATQRSEDN